MTTTSEHTTSARIAPPVPGRPEAAELIWTWRPSATTTAGQQSLARKRVIGSAQASVGVVAGCVFLWLGVPLLARGVFVIAAILFLSAMLSPGGVYTLLDRSLRTLAGRLGNGLMWALMAPSFYLLFFPFRVLFRRGRRDRLARYFQPDAATYWEAHEGTTAASTSHLEQY